MQQKQEKWALGTQFQDLGVLVRSEVHKTSSGRLIPDRSFLPAKVVAATSQEPLRQLVGTCGTSDLKCWKPTGTWSEWRFRSRNIAYIKSCNKLSCAISGSWALPMGTFRNIQSYFPRTASLSQKFSSEFNSHPPSPEKRWKYRRLCIVMWPPTVSFQSNWALFENSNICII